MTLCLPGKLALVGLRGAGKTSVGRALSETLGLSFVDLDDRIAAAAGCAHAGEVIASRGLPAFRQLEREHLRATLAEPRRLVLSTGGGAIEDPSSRELLRTAAVTIWLRAPLGVLRARVAGDENERAAAGVPLRPAVVPADDSGMDEFEVLLERRAPLYRAACRRAVDVEGLTPGEIARRIEQIWRG
jgi:XRE family aerobic/anaerobic benzoate catabolism transcriptional regulator